MKENLYIKTYTKCSICVGKGVIDTSSFRGTNVCPACKGAGKKEHFITLEEFKKLLSDVDDK